MLFFGYDYKVFFAVVKRIVVDVVDYLVPGTVHNLPVHRYQELAAIGDFLADRVDAAPGASNMPHIVDYSLEVLIVYEGELTIAEVDIGVARSR